MGDHAVIRIEIDLAKKSVTDIKISKHLNPIAAAIVLNQVAAISLQNVKMEPASKIIKPTLRMVPEGARKQ